MTSQVYVCVCQWATLPAKHILIQPPSLGVRLGVVIWCNRPRSIGDRQSTWLVVLTFSQVVRAFTFQLKDCGFDLHHGNLLELVR